MSSKRFVDIRVETVKDYDNYLERVKHNTRYKKEKRVVKPDEGFINEFGEIVEGIKSEYAINKIQKAKIQYDEIISEQKNLSKSFREKRTKSIAEGILYFSEGINEDFENNRNGFINRLQELLEDFSKTKNTEVLSFQIHNDEAGNVHVHFFFKNFDLSTGQALNFTRNKTNGEYLQDLAFKHFETFGKNYQRGVKKEKAQKHLTIEEYKELKEAQGELLRAKEELNHTKALNTTLKEDNKLLRASSDEFKSDLKKISNEFEKLIKDFEDFILTETDRDKLLKLKQLFSRYSKNENAERMLSTLSKAKKISKRISKKYDDIGL